MKNTHFLTLILSVLICSCNKSNIEEVKQTDLKAIGAFEVQLDSISPYYTTFVQYKPEENKYFRLNQQNNSIQVFDLQKGSIIKTIFFQSEGESMVDKIFSFNYLNDDSIIIQSSTKKLYICNHNGKVEKFNNLREQMNSARYEQLIFDNNIVYSVQDNGTQKALWSFNYNTNQFKTLGNNPEKLQKGYWSSQSMWTKLAYNTKRKELIIAPIVSNQVEIIDIKSMTSRYENLSTNEVREIEPTTMESVPLEEFEIMYRTYTQNMFGGILYDPFNDRIIRFVNGPLSKEITEQTIYEAKYPYTLILVFDGNYTYINTIKIENPEDKFILNQSFFTKEGLAIRINDTSNENKERYQIFEIQ